MKKTKTHKIMIWMKDAWMKAIVIFLIVAAGFYAYAAITWPGDEPNPTTGVVGMFIGESKDAYGATTNSYDKVNDLCAKHINPGFVGSHVCTQNEMMNSYNHGQPGIAPIYTYFSGGGSATLYINNGPPGYTANSNDCVGWKKTDKGADPQNPNYGAIWNFQAQAGGLIPCAVGKKFACCK